MDAEQFDNTFNNRRFSRAGTAGDDGHAAGDGGFDGLTLLRMESDAFHAFQLVDLRGKVGRHRVRHGVDHFPQAARNFALGTVG